MPVRATEAFKGAVGEAPPGAISELVVLLDGIARVSNLDQLVLGDADETDDELRDRARAALRSVSKGTEAALRRAVQEERATLLELWDPNAPLERRTEPGHVALLVEAEPERFPSLVPRCTTCARRAWSWPSSPATCTSSCACTAKMAPNLPATGQDKLRREVIDALQGYVDGLASGAPAEGAAMLARSKQGRRALRARVPRCDPEAHRRQPPGARVARRRCSAPALSPPPADDVALRDGARRRARKRRRVPHAPSAAPGIRSRPRPRSAGQPRPQRRRSKPARSGRDAARRTARPGGSCST